MTVRGEKLRGAAAPAPLSYFETDAALRGLWAMQSYALFAEMVKQSKKGNNQK